MEPEMSLAIASQADFLLIISFLTILPLAVYLWLMWGSLDGLCTYGPLVPFVLCCISEFIALGFAVQIRQIMGRLNPFSKQDVQLICLVIFLTIPLLYMLSAFFVWIMKRAYNRRFLHKQYDTDGVELEVSHVDGMISWYSVKHHSLLEVGLLVRNSEKEAYDTSDIARIFNLSGADNPASETQKAFTNQWRDAIVTQFLRFYLYLSENPFLFRFPPASHTFLPLAHFLVKKDFAIKQEDISLWKENEKLFLSVKNMAVFDCGELILGAFFWRWLGPDLVKINGDVCPFAIPACSMMLSKTYIVLHS